jgi:hypothetical protein
VDNRWTNWFICWVLGMEKLLAVVMIGFIFSYLMVVVLLWGHFTL